MMTQEELIALLFFLALLTLIALIWLISGADFCFELHGIDHNGRNDPFTIFIGVCN